MYKARVSFSGVVSMHVGETRDITDDNIAKDLLKAGYIEEVKPAEKGKPTKAEEKPTEGKTKRG